MSSQEQSGDYRTEDITAETQRTRRLRRELSGLSLRRLCALCVSAVSLFCLGAPSSSATIITPRQRAPTPPTVAVLDFGGDAFAVEATAELSRALHRDDAAWQLVNRDLARAAARGAGYTGSLNLTRDEARDIGQSIGCDFYFAGRAEVLRRSSSIDVHFYEAYTAVFLVSTRTGRLVMFDYTSAEAETIDEARQALRSKTAENAARYRVALFRAHQDEETARARRVSAVAETDNAAVLIADAPGDEENASPGLRLPQPYRRVRPPYTELAARAAIEATVDVTVEVGAGGEVGNVEVERWAGFGLDEAVVATVRAMHFRPAMRLETGEAVPLRVLLRYNFRRAAPSN